MGLSQRDRDILDFEGQLWTHAGAKESAASQRFALGSVAYYAEVTRLTDDADAEAYAPMTVRRLRRLRDARRAARTG